jgi:3-isopropylmalate dehydrogenase
VSDEAAVLAGSIGLLGSASLGAARPGLFEPIHGSAPDLAGRDAANPVGAVAAAAMLLADGLGLRAEARALEHAIDEVTRSGALTADCGGTASTSDVGRAIADHVAASGSRLG